METDDPGSKDKVSLTMHSASCSGHIEHTTQIFGTITAKWLVVHIGMRGSELQGQKPRHLRTRLMRTRSQKNAIYQKFYFHNASFKPQHMTILRMTTESRQLAGLTKVTASLRTLTAQHNSDDMAHNAPQDAVVSCSASGPTTTSNIECTLKLPNLQRRKITNASSSPSSLLKTSQDLESHHELSFSYIPYFVTTSAIMPTTATSCHRQT